MRKPTVVVLLAAFALCALPATQLMAVVVPPKLPAGTQYQIIFATEGVRDATSPNIADYNAFVASEAALSPTLPSGVAWHAVASTPTVNANVNAPSFLGMPVYNTQGIEVASGATGLYSGSILNAVAYDQFGTASSAPFVWTGSDASGAAFDALSAGGGIPRAGSVSYTNSFWINAGGRFINEQYPLFALSSPVTAVPEPTTLTLFGTALSVIAGVCSLRRRWLTGRKNAQHGL